MCQYLSGVSCEEDVVSPLFNFLNKRHTFTKYGMSGTIWKIRIFNHPTQFLVKPQKWRFGGCSRDTPPYLSTVSIIIRSPGIVHGMEVGGISGNRHNSQMNSPCWYNLTPVCTLPQRTLCSINSSSNSNNNMPTQQWILQQQQLLQMHPL